MNASKGLKQKLTDLPGKILEEDALLNNLDKALDMTKETKVRFDRAVQVFMNVLNLPTVDDLNELNRRIDSLNGKIVGLSLKLDKLMSAEKEKQSAAAEDEAREPEDEALPAPEQTSSEPAPTLDPPTEETVPAGDDLTTLRGIGAATEKRLNKAGFGTIASIASADPKSLAAAVPNYNVAKAEALVAEAKKRAGSK